MDNETVMIVYGSNQMRANGQHIDDGESVLFAYSKGGFPMKAKFPEAENFEVQLEDVASIISSLLDIKTPFSNIGLFHPWFYLGINPSLAL